MLTVTCWDFPAAVAIVAHPLHPHPASRESWGLAVAGPWQLLFPHVLTLKAAGIKGDGEHGKLQVTPLGRWAVCVSS